MRNAVFSRQPNLPLCLTAILVLFYMITYGQTGESPKDPRYNESLIPYQNKTGKWGYLDAKSGRVAIPAQYDKAGFFEGNTALVGNINPDGPSAHYYNKYLNGLIDTSGEELLPVTYSGVYTVKSGNRDVPGLLQLVDGNSWGIVRRTDGQWLIAPDEHESDSGGYTSYLCYDREHFLIGHQVYIAGDRKYKAPEGHRIDGVDRENQLFRISALHDENKKGISDWQGHIIVPARYLEVSYYPENNRFIASGDNMFSQADEDLLARLDEKGRKNLDAADSVALKKLMEKLEANDTKNDQVENHLLDETGKDIARFYSRYFPSVAGDLIVCEKAGTNDYNYFSVTDGSPLSPRQANLGHWYVFREAGLYGLADPEGNTVLPARYHKMFFYDENRIVVSDTNTNKYGLRNFGVINARGRGIIPFNYGQIYPVNNRKHYIVLDRDSKKYGVIDAKENTVVPFKYESNLHFTNGLAVVWNGKYHGVIDSLGREILPLKFNTIFNTKNIDDTAETYFTVKKDNKWGMFDRHGRELIPVKYDYVDIADNYRSEASPKDWVTVKEGDGYGLINIKTGAVVPSEYTKIWPYDQVIEATLSTEDGPQYQFLDLEGKPLPGGPYEQIKRKYGCFVVKKEGKYGLMSAHGKLLLPFSYTSLSHRTPHLLMAERDNRKFVVNREGREYIAD